MALGALPVTIIRASLSKGIGVMCMAAYDFAKVPSALLLLKVGSVNSNHAELSQGRIVLNH